MEPKEPLQKSIDFKVGDMAIYLPTSEKVQIIDIEPVATGMPEDSWRMMIIQFIGTKYTAPLSTAIAARFLRKPLSDIPG